MPKPSADDSFYDQIKQIVDENSDKEIGWRRWIGPIVLTVTGAVIVTRAVLQSGLLHTGGASQPAQGNDLDADLVSCRGCDEFVDEDSIEDGLCDDCNESDETSYCCGMMYTDGEIFCRSCGDPL